MRLLRTEAEMVQAYRDRISELGITFATVDAISGLPDGYTAKLMGPNPLKGLGERAIEGLNGALGIGFVVAVDPEQVIKVEKRWTKRKRPFFSKRPSVSIASRIQLALEKPAQVGSREYMKMIGKHGGKKRAKILGKRARQRIATHAARMRWSKAKASPAP